MNLEDCVQVLLVYNCQQLLNCKISPLVFRNASDFVIDIDYREIDIFKFAGALMFILPTRPIR